MDFGPLHDSIVPGRDFLILPTGSYSFSRLVQGTGLEPVTTGLSARRSTTELTLHTPSAATVGAVA